MRVYQNWILDSTKWDYVSDRAGDVIVATTYKSGTTWVQYIVLNLIHKSDQHKTINDYSAWVENRITPTDKLINKLESQTFQRCLKTHLPADGLPIRINSKYIVVGRDPRDVFMSLWNQYQSYTDDFYSMVNNNQTGSILPRCPNDIKMFWNMWLMRGSFECDTEGYPHWSHFRNIQSWWNLKDNHNILFVHYKDLTRDLDGCIKTIADFIGICCTDDDLQRVRTLCQFDNMKANGAVIIPNSFGTYKQGPNSFFNKGTSNQWIDVLDTSDLILYDDVASTELTTDCRDWLEGK